MSPSDIVIGFIRRSVHNTRIERVWFDFTQGVGGKWKDFFIELECHHGLDPDNPAHIWLLQFLFLSMINQDVAEWVETWNAHKIQLRGERDQSPREMFLFGMVQDGPRGLLYLQQQEDEAVVDLATYGVDWEAQEDAVLMRHFADNNPQDGMGVNFAPHSAPARMSEVVCDSPDSPLTLEQQEMLVQVIGEAVDMTSRNMTIRRVIWQIGFDLCRDLAETVHV
jgi:hypothetical protein